MDNGRPAGYETSQYLTLAIGAVYLLVGLAGFVVTGFDAFTGVSDDTLFGFAVNPLHNLVHLAVGAAGLAAWRSLPNSRGYGWVLLAAYGLTFAYGLAVAGDDALLNVNAADNVLHALSAAAGLVVATAPARRRVAAA